MNARVNMAYMSSRFFEILASESSVTQVLNFKSSLLDHLAHVLIKILGFELFQIF